jgi:hypothetical protein
VVLARPDHLPRITAIAELEQHLDLLRTAERDHQANTAERDHQANALRHSSNSWDLELHVSQLRRSSTTRHRQPSPLVAKVELRGPKDARELLPALPDELFSTRELASTLGGTLLLAQRIAYCLRILNILGARR